MRFRWWICGLLLAATTLNYVDRGVLAVLAPHLTHLFGWSESDYSYIVASFQGAYALGLVFAGAIIDRLGVRLGYTLALGVWALAAMSHALARTVLGFAAARFFLGLAEAGNFPAAVKTVAEWFPRKERALATGIFNAGSNIGALLAAVAVPPISVAFGWQAGFLLTSGLSIAWLVTWWLTYRPPAQHPRLSDKELAYIRSDPPDPAVRLRWMDLIGERQTWAFMAGKLITDPVWWFLLFWLPKFLSSQYGITLGGIGAPLIAVYLMADAGSVGGGWLAGWLLRRGATLNQARKGAMGVCALAVVPIIFAARVHSLPLAVGLIGLGAAGHQGFSANLFTLSSDLFPRDAVGSVVGLGGLAGAVSGMVVSTFTGWVLQSTGSYVPLFLLAGSAYLVALAVIQWLAPRLEPAQVAVPVKGALPR